MNSLIENIKREAISNRWANKKGAQFEYNIENTYYRLIELTPDVQSYLVGRTQRNDKNCPMIAKGFVAYLIRNWGKSEQLIFDKYYENCLNKYKHEEQKKPGSSMRNLDSEFYPIHISQEKELVTFSKQLKPYLSEPEIQLINQYIKAYFNYIEKVFSPKDHKNSIENQIENQLSVPDWCIIFYYLDEAGVQQGAKIDRIIKFITENNVRNSNGKLTTKGSFKKQFYEIYNRINGTENSNGEKLPPLSPERIKNILPFLKKNKKALQTAKNDIVHLLSEMEENKKNDY